MALGGSTVTLDASTSSDPDSNQLSFEWWRYDEERVVLTIQ